MNNEITITYSSAAAILQLPSGHTVKPKFEKSALLDLPAWIDKSDPFYSLYLMHSARSEPYNYPGAWSFERRYENYTSKFPNTDPELILKAMQAPADNTRFIFNILHNALIVEEEFYDE